MVGAAHLPGVGIQERGEPMIRTLEDYQAAGATLEQIKDGLDGSSRRTAEFLSRQIEAWDTAYGAGYAAGKEKAFFEIRMRLAA